MRHTINHLTDCGWCVVLMLHHKKWSFPSQNQHRTENNCRPRPSILCPSSFSSSSLRLWNLAIHCLQSWSCCELLPGLSIGDIYCPSLSFLHHGCRAAAAIQTHLDVYLAPEICSCLCLVSSGLLYYCNYHWAKDFLWVLRNSCPFFVCTCPMNPLRGK